MKKAVTLWMSALIAFTLGTTAAELALAGAPEAIQRIHDQVLAPTVRVSTDGGKCSGQVVWSKRDEKTGDVETLILTAAHCTKGSDTVYQVDFPVYGDDNRLLGERTWFAHLAGRYWKADVALLRLKDTDTWFEDTVRLADPDTALYQGEDVLVAGYPKGMDLTLVRGLLGPVIEMNKIGGKLREYYRATPDIIGGNSGGGLYHLGADGWELIGIATAVHRDASWFGIYTPIADIVDYLETAAPGVVGKGRKTTAATH